MNGLTAIYMRVSTDDQRLDSQQRELKRFCQHRESVRNVTTRYHALIRRNSHGRARAATELALKEGSRLLSVYHSATGVKFYIITEADRSMTTVLLPEDY